MTLNEYLNQHKEEVIIVHDNRYNADCFMFDRMTRSNKSFCELLNWLGERLKVEYCSDRSAFCDINGIFEDPMIETVAKELNLEKYIDDDDNEEINYGELMYGALLQGVEIIFNEELSQMILVILKEAERRSLEEVPPIQH